MALTAWISELWQEKALQVGIVTYLIKPVAPQTLKQTIERNTLSVRYPTQGYDALRLKKQKQISILFRAKSYFGFSARAEYTSDDQDCIHKSLSRISLFFRLRGRPGSGGDHTLFRQQPLGTSCLPWLYPHRVSCQLSNLIVACGMGSVNKVEKESSKGGAVVILTEGRSQL